jgi:plasmid replication initiation protein
MLPQKLLAENTTATASEPKGDGPRPASPEAPESVEVLGRDEMNLAEFPIAALTDYVPKGQNTIRFGDASGNLMITGSDAYGLPTAADADVIVAMIQLTKRRNKFSRATVHFTRAELLEILGWAESGKSYRRLTESLMRWSTTSLKYEGTWWDQKARRRINAVFHIINEVVLFDRADATGGPAPQPPSYFTWNKIFLESCQAGNLKRLDLQMYFALEHASSKRLYRFLDKRLHRQPDQVFDLADVAFERVGLSRGYVGKKGGVNVGKVREKLEPAVDELIARGFLLPMAREERYRKQGKAWTVRFARAAAASPAEEGPGEAATAEVPGASGAEGPGPIGTGALAEELIRRGVTRSRSELLVRRFPEDVIAEKVEVFDWRLAKDPRGLKTNPAGWLVKAIEDGYPAPPGFERKAAREARQRQEQSAAEQAERKRDEVRRRDRDRQAVHDYRAGLQPGPLARLQAEALAAAPDEARREYESPAMAPSLRRALLNVLVREHVEDRLRREGPALF